MKNRNIFLRLGAGLLFATVSCSTHGGISRAVQVYSQESTLTKNCRKIGPIEATTSSFSRAMAVEKASTEGLIEIAQQEGANAVVFLSANAHGFSSATARGIALLCPDNFTK